MTNPSEPVAWETCPIGSCHRHQDCMYRPCRNTRPTAPASSELVEDGTARRVQYLLDAETPTQRYERAAHLTGYDWRAILTALRAQGEVEAERVERVAIALSMADPDERGLPDGQDMAGFYRMLAHAALAALKDTDHAE